MDVQRSTWRKPLNCFGEQRRRRRLESWVLVSIDFVEQRRIAILAAIPRQPSQRLKPLLARRFRELLQRTIAGTRVLDSAILNAPPIKELFPNQLVSTGVLGAPGTCKIDNQKDLGDESDQCCAPSDYRHFDHSSIRNVSGEAGVAGDAFAERGGPRRADDGQIDADGHDLRAEYWRDQPLPAGAYCLGGLRGRGECALRDCAGVGGRVSG